jgi:hypothetical protein
MAAWVRAMPAVERNTGVNFDSIPKWQMFARVLNAARSYE